MNDDQKSGKRPEASALQMAEAREVLEGKRDIVSSHAVAFSQGASVAVGATVPDGDRRPTPQQETLAKEVLEGKREITASTPKGNMADIPEHVKAKGLEATANLDKSKIAIKDMGESKAVDNYGDRGKELAAMREQKRLEELRAKTPEPTRPPDRS
jgi:hypothetical protein